MKYNNIPKITLLCSIIASSANIHAMTWGEYLWSFVPTRQSATQLATKLSTQWTNLTPTQQKVAAGAVVVAAGCAGVCLYKKYQERQRNAAEKLLDKIAEKKGVTIVVNETDKPWEATFTFPGEEVYQLEDEIFSVVANGILILGLKDAEDYNTNIRANKIHIATRNQEPTRALLNPLNPSIYLRSPREISDKSSFLISKSAHNDDIDIKKLNQQELNNEIAKIKEDIK